MKLHALKRRSPGLICIFLISAIFYGCTSLLGEPEIISPQAGFSPEYYILKRTTPADYERLERLSNSQDIRSAASASLILGYYSLKENDTELARQLIEPNYQNPALDPYMWTMGELWMIEVALSEENYNEAARLAENVQLRLNEMAVTDALETYCITQRLYPEPGAGPYSCVETRLGGQTVQHIEAPEALEGDLDILVITQKDMMEVSGGIYFYLKQHDLQHKVRLSRTMTEGEWDYIINMDTVNVIHRGSRVEFRPELPVHLAAVTEDVGFDGCNLILIGKGRGLEQGVERLRNRLESSEVSLKVVDIQDNAAVRSVRSALIPWIGRNFCSIGVGTEEEIQNFVPNVRAYMSRNIDQPIYTIVDIDTGRHYTRNYLNYYRDSYVFPIVEYTLSDEAFEFSREYKNFSGREVTYETIMGYDMMHYVYKNTVEGLNDTTPYLTGITGFAGGKAIREVRGFYINRIGEPEPLILSLDREDISMEQIISE